MRLIAIVLALTLEAIVGSIARPIHSGFGSGSVADTMSGTTLLAALAEDYYAALKTHTKWRKFPVTVFFVRDHEYSTTREQEARTGFSRWTEATRGFVAFKVVEIAKGADMLVRFDPNSDDGYTTTTFTSGRLVKAHVKVGVRRGWPHDIQCVAAHEFGHALGINGHSNVVQDLMFPTHNMGTAWQISQRDLNTLAAIYRPAVKITATWTPAAG